MAKLVRHEFLGSRILFFLLCATGILVPFAVLYLIEGLVTVEEEMESPGEFVEEWRAGRHRSG